MLPPRESYQVEAITKSDEPDLPGWAYFLDLWTETARRACTSKANSRSRAPVHGAPEPDSALNRHSRAPIAAP